MMQNIPMGALKYDSLITLEYPFSSLGIYEKRLRHIFYAN